MGSNFLAAETDFVSASTMSAADIVIKGAREHNLRDVSLTLPRNQLICLTGVSGSGKSSLAFDTLYAEGQRRYVESLSSFARQFLGQMPKPDVDLHQRAEPVDFDLAKILGQNPRSTVGTITEIYDYLRVLYARTGLGSLPRVPPADHGPDPRPDHRPHRSLFRAGTRFALLAPLIRGQKGEYRDLFEDLLQAGFVRARVDGSNRPAHRRPAARPADAAQHRSGHRPARRSARPASPLG